MNFNSHLIRLHRETKEALSLDKGQLLLKLKDILIDMSELLQTNEYDFWLNQLDNIPFQEFPITKYGVKDQGNFIDKEMNNSSICRGMAIELERVCTFWEEDDLCEMQGQFYYYKSMKSNQVFSESEFGFIRGGSTVNMNEVSIATVTDLKLAGIVNQRKEEQLLK